MSSNSEPSHDELLEQLRALEDGREFTGPDGTWSVPSLDAATPAAEIPSLLDEYCAMEEGCDFIGAGGNWSFPELPQKSVRQTPAGLPPKLEPELAPHDRRSLAG